MNRTVFRWMVLAVGLLWAVAIPGKAEDEDDIPPGARTLTAKEIDGVVAQATEMLRVVKPTETKGGIQAPWKVMESDQGVIRWGNLFRADQVAALVNLQTTEEPTNGDSYVYPARRDLCYFVWKGDRWEFRQYLGNAGDLERHFRKDKPSIFLQGSALFGPHDGEHLSWSFDEATDRLARTNFEDWGPFTLKGDYMVCSRGFERLAHDGTSWIYPYKGGKKGELIARFHENDSGDFDVHFREPSTGQYWTWLFRQDREDDSRMTVEVRKAKKNEDEYGLTGDSPPLYKAEVAGFLDSIEIFQLLTGLNPALIGSDEWQDKLPPMREVGPLSKFEIRGDAEIRSRLGGLEPEATDAWNSHRILALMSDVTPGEVVKGSATISNGLLQGEWGPLFGGSDIQALVSVKMPSANEYEPPAELYLLHWQQGWKVSQEVGKVSAQPLSDGRLGWKIHKDTGRATSYVVSQSDTQRRDENLSWRYDPKLGTLLPTGWPKDKTPSIAGDTITLVSVAYSEPDSPALAEVYRFNGEIGSRVGTVRRSTSGRPTGSSIIVPDPQGGKDIVWRIRKPRQDDRPDVDVYELCRDEAGDRREFHTDGTIEFNWGQEYAESSAAVYLWWRLTGTGQDAYFGRWEDEKVRPLRIPKTAKVTGLPEAKQLFEWPKSR